ncbi:hypothetical protein IMZ48_19425 [Candidatus Bathyarchaeota archaeon]|nr:hypothetical protein [Candidatus Bathyarchaeota archaeon]
MIQIAPFAVPETLIKIVDEGTVYCAYTAPESPFYNRTRGQVPVGHLLDDIGFTHKDIDPQNIMVGVF